METLEKILKVRESVDVACPLGIGVATHVDQNFVRVVINDKPYYFDFGDVQLLDYNELFEEEWSP